MNKPEESEFAAGSYGRTQSGQLRPLTRAEIIQAHRSARIRQMPVEQAAVQLINGNKPATPRYPA